MIFIQKTALRIFITTSIQEILGLKVYQKTLERLWKLLIWDVCM